MTSRPRGLSRTALHALLDHTKSLVCLPQKTRVRGTHEEVPDGIPVQRMSAGVPAAVRPDLRYRLEDVQQRLFLGNGELSVPVTGQQTVSRRLRTTHRRAQKLLVLILCIISYNTRRH